jgi:DNA polymerase III epsilon subunit-like protein
MGYRVLHANHNHIACLDVETTGLDPKIHEIVQIAIIVLNHKFEPDTDYAPFCVTMRPDRPETVEPGALKVNGLTMEDIMTAPLTQQQGREALYQWYSTLALLETKKIQPLGHNYAFDMSFMKEWLGVNNYYNHFDYHYRDSMIAAQLLNDRAYILGERIPFPHVGLGQVAKGCDLDHKNAHNALSDVLMCIKVYKRLMRRNIM